MFDAYAKLESYSDDDTRGGGNNAEAGPSGLPLKENQQPPLHTQPGPSKGAKAARPGLVDTRQLTAPKLKGTAGGGGTTFSRGGTAELKSGTQPTAFYGSRCLGAMQDALADSAAGAVRRQSSRVQKREAEQARPQSGPSACSPATAVTPFKLSDIDSVQDWLQRAIILSLPHHTDTCCQCRARSPSPWTTRTTRRVQRQLAQQRAGSAAPCATMPTGALLMCSRCAAVMLWRRASCTEGAAGPHPVRGGIYTNRLPGMRAWSTISCELRCSASVTLTAKLRRRRA